MNRLYKVPLGIVLIFALLMCCTSCALIKGPIEDNEFIDIITPLLEKDAALSGYIWGSSFETKETPKEEDLKAVASIYYTVASDAPYQSVQQLRDAALEIYSSELVNIIEQYAFENGETTMARFCDDYDDEGNVCGLRLDISSNHTPYSLTAVAYINTARVKRSTNNMIEGEIEITAGSSQRKSTMELKLLKQDDIWKLDTQTWLSGISYDDPA